MIAWDWVKTMKPRACSTLIGHPEVNHAHTLPASGKHKACSHILHDLCATTTVQFNSVQHAQLVTVRRCWSPSADHCCGPTARHEWRRWSPSADHCCGPTARHEWRRWSASADHCCGPTARHEWRHNYKEFYLLKPEWCFPCCKAC